MNLFNKIKNYFFHKQVKEYVAGFYFSEDRKQVALILKDRPKWQKGKLNAIGGKIEKDERMYNAMRREFVEETGYPESWWVHFCTLSGQEFYDLDSKEPHFKVHFFYSFGDLKRLKNVTDEPIKIHDVCNLPENIISNISWLIPMALSVQGKDASKNSSYEVREVW